MKNIRIKKQTNTITHTHTHELHTVTIEKLYAQKHFGEK